MLNWCQVGYPSMFCLPLILINHQPGELIVHREATKNTDVIFFHRISSSNIGF